MWHFIESRTVKICQKPVDQRLINMEGDSNVFLHIVENVKKFGKIKLYKIYLLKKKDEYSSNRIL